MIDQRILICAVASVMGHFLLGEALSTLPPRESPIVQRKIEVRVIEPAKPPPPLLEPPKPPDPPPPPQEVKPAVKPAPSKAPAGPAAATVHDIQSKAAPIATHAVVAPEAPAGPPVFGVTMESTSQGGTGPAVQTGNTTVRQPEATGAGPTRSSAAGAPVAAYEVTQMPIPKGRCSGKYTEAARAAALEGVVVLDLVVDAEGRATDIKVVKGLAHGLTESAIAALEACRFTPGQKDGQPVAVRVRGFKVSYFMTDAN